MKTQQNIACAVTTSDSVQQGMFAVCNLQIGLARLLAPANCTPRVTDSAAHHGNKLMVNTKKVAAGFFAPAPIIGGPTAVEQLRLFTYLMTGCATLAPQYAASQRIPASEGYYLTITPPQPTREELDSRWASALQNSESLAELLRMNSTQLESVFNRFDTPTKIRSIVKQYLENYRNLASN